MTRRPTHKESEERIKGLEKKFSRHKPARKVLGEFREFREKIISESPIGMSIYDPSGQCIAANDSIAELIGATRNQVLEQNYNNIASWKKSGMLDKAKSAVREKSKKRYELKVKSTFGKDVSLDCHLIPFSSEGQTHLLVMINDISERLRAEKALQESKEKLAGIIKSVTDAMIMVDKEFNITWSNEIANGLFEPDLVGDKCYASYHRCDTVCEPCIVQMCFEDGKVHDFETDITDADGNQKTFWCTASVASWDEEGRPKMVVESLRDITTRKKANQELREREATLKIRTNELEEANTALKVLLKRREEDKTEVEEKVLLNVKELVVPYAQKLKKTSLDEQQIAYLNLLESNLNDIISPFMHKLSSKALALTPKEIHVANLVKDGKTAKEIAGLLNVSVRTIESHRKSIRAKIGLKNSRINLRVRLLSI